MAHGSTCAIRTTVENPRLMSYNTSISPEERKEQAKIVDDYLKQGIIEPSNAPWSSNSLLVRKSDGKMRLVIDFRNLNKVTIKDAYPMPKIQDLTDNLKGSWWLTTLDCVQAFHQSQWTASKKFDDIQVQGGGTDLNSCGWTGECHANLDAIY